MEENIQTLNRKLSFYSTKFIYVALIIIPFAASFSSAVTTVVSVFTIVVFLTKRAYLKNFSFNKTPIKWPYLLIVCLSLISFVKTVDLRASIQGMWKLFYYGSLFTIIIEELKDAKHAWRIITAAILGLLLASSDGIWQLYFGWDFIRHRSYAIQSGLGSFPRIRAAFPHTNIFAAYLGLFIPLALSMFMYNWGKGIRRTFYLTVLILALFCLFWTFSQGTVAGFVIALIFIGIIRKNKSIFILLICLIVMAAIGMPEGIKYLIKDARTIWEFILNPNRIGDFRNALNMIKHNPILGVGVNTYCLNIHKYFVRDNSIYIGSAGYSHNIYLHMTAEIGIFGLIAFLWLIFSLFRHGLKKYKLIQNSFLKISTLGIMAGLITFLINGFTETVLYYPKVSILFWYEVGLLLGIIKISDKTSFVNSI